MLTVVKFAPFFFVRFSKISLFHTVAEITNADKLVLLGTKRTKNYIIKCEIVEHFNNYSYDIRLGFILPNDSMT